jgi:hypothetical protein
MVGRTTPRRGTVWFALMYAAVGLSILAALLECLGVFRDFGIVLALAGTPKNKRVTRTDS